MARAPPERGAHFCPDPSERRTGNAPSPELAAVLTKTVEDAKALASERQVQMKVATTQKALADAVEASSANAEKRARWRRSRSGFSAVTSCGITRSSVRQTESYAITKPARSSSL